MWRLSSTQEALEAIAKEAIKRNTGARGLESDHRRHYAGCDVRYSFTDRRL